VRATIRSKSSPVFGSDDDVGAWDGCALVEGFPFGFSADGNEGSGVEPSAFPVGEFGDPESIIGEAEDGCIDWASLRTVGTWEVVSEGVVLIEGEELGFKDCGGLSV
jgi:hypothetical protein